MSEVKADGNRLSELLIYQGAPGNARRLLSRSFAMFHTYKRNNDLNVVGYWVPEENPGRTKHSSTWSLIPAGRKRKDMGRPFADPTFPRKGKQVNQLIEKAGEEYRVDEVYMRPTNYSAMR